MSVKDGRNYFSRGVTALRTSVGDSIGVFIFTMAL